VGVGVKGGWGVGGAGWGMGGGGVNIQGMGQFKVYW
jgi:hypothetical protein